LIESIVWDEGHVTRNGNDCIGSTRNLTLNECVSIMIGPAFRVVIDW
jgi:hypothetical protein